MRIVTRSGWWVTLEEDGTITTQQGTWDWDSVSHPERAGNWSELWIIVYPSTFGDQPVWGDPYDAWEGTTGFGHQVERTTRDAVTGQIAQWKAAHTLVRTVIWTTDGTLFDPNNPASLPDGTWGAWSSGGSGTRVASGRNRTSCRYWEA